MEIRELAVPNAWEITPILRGDDRGVFLESFRADHLREATGRGFELRQGNISVSRYGVGRGIHWADLPGGQAKYFTVVAGSAVDFIVDIRIGSPTFGEWTSVALSDENRKAVFLSEGLGHMFVVTSPTATVSYSINGFYDKPHEHGLNPLDPALGIEFPVPAPDLVLSPQDAEAPTLAEAEALGLLPTYGACLAHYEAS